MRTKYIDGVDKVNINTALQIFETNWIIFYFAIFIRKYDICKYDHIYILSKATDNKKSNIVTLYIIMAACYYRFETK